MSSWPSNNHSYLDIIIGPMFSGKTSRIIEIYNYCINNSISVIAINHILDQRYGSNNISSHDSITIPCIQIEKLNDIYLNKEYNKILLESNVILINEAQFFEDLFNFAIDLVDNKYKKVHICGLDGDFKRNKFGQLSDLIPYCNTITKLNAICNNCTYGQAALFSHRITNEEQQTCIGSTNYSSLCRQCYIKKNYKS